MEIPLESPMKFNKTMLALASSTTALALFIGAPALAQGSSHPAAHSMPAAISANAAAPMSGAKSPHLSVRANKTLLDAAEPFENLTEMAFSANWSKIDHSLSKAEHAASRAHGVLSQDAAGMMAQHLAAMKSARLKHHRADLALSSIEVYRVLVSSVSDQARIPTQVSLLDYAGFRYDADLKSSPTRWDDMNQAVDFAHLQWAVIAPRLEGVPVATRFEKAVSGMDRAARQKDTSLAASSVKSESDLVDELEAHFRKHP